MKKNPTRTLLKTMTTCGLFLSLSQPILTVTTVLAAPATTIQELEHEELSIKQLIKDQKVTLSELVGMLAVKEKEVQLILSKIHEKEAALATLTKKIDAKNAEITTLEKEIKRVEGELEKKIELYEKNVAIAEKRVQALQIMDKDKATLYLDILFNQTSLTDAVSEMKAVGILLGAHEKQIETIERQAEEIKAMKADLDKQKTGLVKERQELETLESTVQTERKALVSEKKKSDKMVADLSSERKALEKAYNKSVNDLSVVQETKAGIRLEEQLRQAEEARLAMEAATANGAAYRSMPLSATLDYVRAGQPDEGTVHAIISKAKSYLGVPYVWGGTTPSGFDCSGLTQYVYRNQGIHLPRVTQDQVKMGVDVPLSEVLPGDLLFWEEAGDVYHVGIYIGDGNFIHAPTPGETVKITNVRNFTPTSARRVIEPKQWTHDQTQTALSLGTFQATAYAIGEASVPGTVTANGTNIAHTIHTPDGHRIVAVDPNVIPMNTLLLVEVPGMEPFTAVASDTGGAIKGNIIDILVSSISEANRFGRQHGIQVSKIKR